MSSEGLHVPRESLSKKTLELHYAIASLMEELEAVDWYRQRADDTKDPELKAVILHNAREEMEHAAMVLEWIRRNDADFDRNLRKYLFQEGSIVGREKEAEGKDSDLSEDDRDAWDEEEPRGGEVLTTILAEAMGERLDKALAGALPELSRARIQALIAAGAVSLDGAPALDASAKARPGLYQVLVPAPVSATPEPQDLGLGVLYEDADLIVVDKPAGMAAHPAPGSPDNTLVNALLFHCGESLSGIGGVARPGIVHRLDKGTSGVMVAAKTDAAHRGLSALFERHDIERLYIAFVRGAPQPRKGTIQGRIARSRFDRKKMALVKAGGREAVTHYVVEQVFGPAERPLAARVACRLETGRTHQIRVHLASKGAPVLGDPTYGSGAPAAVVREAVAAAGLSRQALHAAVLGFVHPVTGERLRFETPLPPEMARLETELASRI